MASNIIGISTTVKHIHSTELRSTNIYSCHLKKQNVSLNLTSSYQSCTNCCYTDKKHTLSSLFYKHALPAVTTLLQSNENIRLLKILIEHLDDKSFKLQPVQDLLQPFLS